MKTQNQKPKYTNKRWVRHDFPKQWNMWQNNLQNFHWVSFASVGDGSMADTLSDTPLGKTNFLFTSGCLLGIASWLKIVNCVYLSLSEPGTSTQEGPYNAAAVTMSSYVYQSNSV